MSRDADVVVLGAGIVGAATARALAGRAGSVLLLEQFELGHARGSSHGTSRIFRLNYPDERFVRLAQEADAAWRELEVRRGETLIERVGSLDLGPVAADTARALAACGVRYERLSAEQIGERWPIRVDADDTGVFQADGGFMHAQRAFEAVIAEARDGGVEIRERSPVRALNVRRGSVGLELDSGHVEARSVVVTAGAWAAGLLARVEIDLDAVPTRESVVYVDLTGADALPPVIDYGSLPSSGFGVPSRGGQAAYALAAPGVGLKAGLHHSGPPVDPSSEPETDERVIEWVRQWVSSRYDGAGQTLGVETCLYTNTPDERFVLERHGRVIVGSACSGHGFKFAPVVGRRLASLALDAAA